MHFRTTFRTKLLLLTIVPLGVAQLVTLFAVMRTVEQDVESRARDSLNIGAAVVNEFLAARHEQLLTSIEVLAADYGLKEAAATGDANTIRSVLANHSKRVGADVAALLDSSGVTTASTLDLGPTHLIDTQFLESDLTDEMHETTAFVDGTAFHVFAVPLRAPITIGWVVLGFRIDAPLRDRIADLTGLDTAIVNVQGTPVVITTSTDFDPTYMAANPMLDVVYLANDADDRRLAIQTPFIPGNSAVLVVLERSLREAMLPYVQARRGLFAFGATLLILVALAGGWISTTIARPLRTLGDAARRIISGDYETHVSYQSDDELGELASSFNAMQSAIGEREQRISHHALHDSLTDLPNRAKIASVLTGAIEHARKADSGAAVISVRLARMSEISSTLGHNATDELIKMAARNLRGSLKDSETLGHTGTNEFVIVLPGCDVDDALACVDRVHGILSAGVTLGRVNVILQTECGIAAFPLHGDAAADLLRFASIARTDAESGKERVRVYQPGREDEFRRRLRIVNDLPAALRRGDVQTWYQPKIALPGGRVCGAEALVRWEHPELGLLSPDDFIPAAEQSGTIIILTRHVLSEAVRECRNWETAGHTLQISVNLAARDLLDEYLPYHVIQILQEHGLPAERLTLEVTESSIMENLQHAVSVLDCLRDIGVKISMDDFGTGHSSLAQLRDIPLNELKVDKSFVMSLCNDRHNHSIVKTTVDLAHSMQLAVVAEGVEDERTLRRIAHLGCEQAQGYFLSRPLPVAELLTWLAEFQPVSYDDRRGDDRAFAMRSQAAYPP